jgi:hypothetical protein
VCLIGNEAVVESDLTDVRAAIGCFTNFRQGVRELMGN